ncbi:MAG: sulfite exporter TauE/SafE family protein [Cyanobacteria bacterium HKST-UBA02]|nr:sulfite exporter TauE/SafE family protein [Cyanobacteria bacterium HKST-UBA02]
MYSLESLLNGSAEAAVAGIAGGVASICGFGIGSILTPFLSLTVDLRLAVAMVSIPHFAGTLLRLMMLRKSIDRTVLLNFGILSAIGGLAGAFLFSRADDRALTMVFAALLIFAGSTGLSGVSEKWRFGKKTGFAAGLISGLFGGMVGNQGGIRSAALLGFDLDREQFVATATAIALIVDLARMPVYFASTGNQLLEQIPALITAVVGVVAGTLLGRRALSSLPEKTFRKLVSGLILLLGAAMLLRLR